MADFRPIPRRDPFLDDEMAPFIRPFSTPTGLRGATPSFFGDAYGRRPVPLPDYAPLVVSDSGSDLRHPGPAALVSPVSGASGARGARPSFVSSGDETYGSPAVVQVGPVSYAGDTWGAVALAGFATAVYFAAHRRRG